MNYLLFGDWHLGVKQDDPWIQNIQRTLINLAIEYSKSNKIKTWIQAGDIFDVRKAVSHKTMMFSREIIQDLKDAHIDLHIIVGNHDLHYREQMHPNACTELLEKYDNVKVYSEPTTLQLDHDVQLDLIPWICDENRAKILNFISNSKSEYCVGHFELNGFYFYKGLKSHGVEPDFLKKYKAVWSGHFHTISSNKNVLYLGSPWTLTAGDENDVRGFWNFDTSLPGLDFIANPIMWHQRIDYPSVNKINFDDYKNKSVRLYVSEFDKDFAKFETELEKVVHDLKIINRVDTKVEKVDQTESSDLDVKSIEELMDDYISNLPDVNQSDVNQLKSMARSLYQEAN